MTSQSEVRRRLDATFMPASVAVIGASDDKDKMGGRVLASILLQNYAGEVFPINPRGGVVQGKTAFKSLDAIGRPVDLAIICLPQDLVEENAHAAGRAGAKAVVVFASGYAETGSEGAAAQERLVKIAQQYSFELIGPNCLGVINGTANLAATSSIMTDYVTITPGPAALVTQSGALGAYWFDEILAAGLGIGKWISTGNEAGVCVAPLMDYFVEDEQTGIVNAYVEGMRDGIAFRKALVAAVRKEKPVVILRAGRSASGAKAVASHTGSLAGADEITTALLQQHGVCQADSIREMIDLARIFSTQKVSPGRRACIISVSGGAGALMTDAASLAGFEVPDLTAEMMSKFREILPDYVAISNPIDLTTHVLRDDELLARTIEIVMQSGAFDNIFIFISGRTPRILSVYSRALTMHLPTWTGNHVVVWKSATPATLVELQKRGVATFDEISPAVLAVGRAVASVQRRQTLSSHRDVPEHRSTGGAEFLSEVESKRYLVAQAGIAVPNSVLVPHASEVDGAIAQLKPPFALKLQSRDMLHKSGAGGIALGLRDAKSVKAEVEHMAGIAKARKIRFEGVLIEEMKEIEHEFLLGLRVDPSFGPLLVFGRGGTAVEVDPDVFRAFLPLGAVEIEARIKTLRLAPLLAGFRGKPAVCTRALAEAIERISEVFLAQSELAEIEINPLVVDGEGDIWVLDALVSRGASATT